MVGVISVCPLLGVDPVGQMRLRIQNKHIYHNFPRFKEHAKARRYAGGIGVFVHENCYDGLSFVRS